MIKEIDIKSNKRNEMMDISSDINDFVNESGIKKGLCFVFCPHTTAGITINEGADPDVKKDIMNYLEKLVPYESNFKHSEGNSDAHIKSSLVGVSETIIIDKNKLVLGTWQSIYFAEFDGPRNRKVIVKIIEF